MYPDRICELCFRDLRNFASLKRDLSSKQRKLYKLIPKQANVQKDQVVEAVIEVLGEAGVQEVITDQIMLIEVPTIKCRRPRAPKAEQQDEKVQCECGITLASKSSLKLHHDRVHLRIRNFFCDFCLYSSFYKHSLEKHIVQHIPDVFRDRFLCELCDFVSKSAVNIERHKKYEHSEVKTLYSCNECCKTFSRPGQLNAHVRLTHEKRKDHICNLCQRAFSTSKIYLSLNDVSFSNNFILATRLKEHISSHAKVRIRDFACEFCAKQFLSHRQLKNHQVYHEQPKFTCQECGKAFYKKILLEGHQKTHVEQKDFICPFIDCGKSYFLKTHLKRHVQSMHDKIK